MGIEYKVGFAPEAKQAILDRADYIASQSGSRITADRYIEGISTFCQSLSKFPRKNIKRDDLFPNLHITNYLGTTIIAYLVNDDAKTVYVIDVFSSRQNYERLLNSLP